MEAERETQNYTELGLPWWSRYEGTPNERAQAWTPSQELDLTCHN